MNVLQEHRNFLKDYEGLTYSIALEGFHKIKWATEKKKYLDKNWSPEINCIGRKKNRLTIEFDGENPTVHLEKLAALFKEKGWGFIRSTHHGRCDYLWIQFNREISDKEAEEFLKWIAPEGSEIDLNFASSNKVFPALYAIHWKHSYFREMPIETFQGKVIDYDSLGISKKKTAEKEFEYKTYTKPASIFGRKGQAQEFYEKQPYFYDHAALWWLWKSNEFCWKLTDEVDILNMINESIGSEVIKSVERNEILNALKQFGRTKIPKEVKPTWIQFKNEIFDIKTGEALKPSPEYFVVNPIPYELHKEKFMNTPTMDRIFEEWVGKENVRTLYQIIAYCLLPSYPLNRLFCFMGAGMNGKSKFLELLTKFIGENNCTSTELDTLLASRFEVTRLHKKLICQIGETNFNELSKTSMLKKLTGGDLIGFEYKNKNPFEGMNYAKIIISTNNLPSTSDKSIGFYRRWLIVDFPNQFSEQKDILAEIPEEEYQSLALKSCFVLKDLLDERRFYNEGSVEDRMERYEAKSNFLQKFVKQLTEESFDGYITKSDFNKRFAEWSRENRHRQMSDLSIGLEMKKLGMESGKKDFQWMNDGKGGQARTWIGVKWKD